mmetsp:Transcript_20851/g.59807  ORF Transcript_20851/g.59807 Transcript_20851/m.59807 type:complete len:237 (+) Transcript_20851:405-1115(+)
MVYFTCGYSSEYSWKLSWSKRASVKSLRLDWPVVNSIGAACRTWWVVWRKTVSSHNLCATICRKRWTECGIWVRGASSMRKTPTSFRPAVLTPALKSTCTSTRCGPLPNLSSASLRLISWILVWSVPIRPLMASCRRISSWVISSLCNPANVSSPPSFPSSKAGLMSKALWLLPSPLPPLPPLSPILPSSSLALAIIRSTSFWRLSLVLANCLDRSSRSWLIWLAACSAACVSRTL